MSAIWKVKREGSTVISEYENPADILEGFADGIWSSTDEVMGPKESRWSKLETHPLFAIPIDEYEQGKLMPVEEETRLDMNPLIDVSLVLLIFFILTTTVEELRKELPAPVGEPDKTEGKSITEKELNENTLRVTAAMQGMEPILTLESQQIPLDNLEQALKAKVNETNKKSLAVEIQPNVPWGVFTLIQDAAAGAGIQETLRINRQQPP